MEDRVYHIYRIFSENGLAGAQMLNEITSSTAVLDIGDTYILNKKVYYVTQRTALNFSGIFAHLYIFEYDEELTKSFIEMGII